jgi:SAM-dependent methyltransferase
MKKVSRAVTTNANRILRGTVLFMSLLVLLSAGQTAFGAPDLAAPTGGSPNKMNVLRYDETARGVNAPMYDYYARKIKEKTGITKGTCLDVGSGGGYLGLALAKITDLDVTFLDISAEALERAKVHIVEDGLQKRAKTLLADVHRIPLPDGSVNLVISRGSIPFWKDPAVALKEIYRVLAPGGMAYVGGGRGTPEVKAQIEARKKELGLKTADRPNPDKMRADKGPGRLARHNYDEILKTTDIPKYSINRGDDGMWIQLWK